MDRLCAELFLSPSARRQNDNLLFVRDYLLRNREDPAALLTLYAQVLSGKPVPNEEANPLIDLLKLYPW